MQNSILSHLNISKGSHLLNQSQKGRMTKWMGYMLIVQAHRFITNIAKHCTKEEEETLHVFQAEKQTSTANSINCGMKA